MNQVNLVGNLTADIKSKRQMAERAMLSSPLPSMMEQTMMERRDHNSSDV